jgi:L-threonylcarbamoyladenylate synthase
MIKLSKAVTDKAIGAILAGGVGVMPTDTIYGIVGSALEKGAVTRIYSLRRRNLKKPMIVLIGDVNDLRLFGVRTNAKVLEILRRFWPGKISIVLRCDLGRGARGVVNKKWGRFKYLHRGGETLAFRLPKPLWLRCLLQKTGPLVAPSANFEGDPPAMTIREAKKYFGKNVDFYLNTGPSKSAPSTVLKIEKGKVVILRGINKKGSP